MIYYAPTLATPSLRPSVFLAGSIEMGNCEDWQKNVGETLDKAGFDVYNPRRPDWDSSWEATIDNPEFVKQVNWELEHLNRADFRLFYFDPTTKSMITLLELGIMAGQWNNDKWCGNDILVVCPSGYCRKGNVDIICKNYELRQHNSLEDAISVIRNLT